jgi:hypothetical protein
MKKWTYLSILAMQIVSCESKTNHERLEKGLRGRPASRSVGSGCLSGQMKRKKSSGTRDERVK